MLAQRELEAAGTAVEVIWKGPLTENDRSAQISVVENFISQGVDGIMPAPLDDSALVAPVDKAERAGIPVIIFDSGLNTDKIVLSPLNVSMVLTQTVIVALGAIGMTLIIVGGHVTSSGKG